MLKMIRELFSLLAPYQVRLFYTLQPLVVVMAFAELTAIASIAPLMALVGDIGLLEKEGVFAKLYQFSGLTNFTDFLFYTGVAVLLTLILSTVISIFTIWSLSLYVSRAGTELADRLYKHYIEQDWLFHAHFSSALLTKQVATEALRVTDTIIQLLMMMNAKVVLAAFISVGISVYDPTVAVVGLLLFSSVYFLMYRLVRKSLDINALLSR